MLKLVGSKFFAMGNSQAILPNTWCNLSVQQRRYNDKLDQYTRLSIFRVIGCCNSPASAAEEHAGACFAHLDDRHGVSGLRDGERGAAGLEDAGLLPRDLRQRVAQHGHMVVAQRCYAAREGRPYHVCGIQAAAQAHLQNCYIHFLRQERLQACMPDVGT